MLIINKPISKNVISSSPTDSGAILYRTELNKNDVFCNYTLIFGYVDDFYRVNVSKDTFFVIALEEAIEVPNTELTDLLYK